MQTREPPSACGYSSKGRRIKVPFEASMSGEMSMRARVNRSKQLPTIMLMVLSKCCTCSCCTRYLGVTAADIEDGGVECTGDDAAHLNVGDAMVDGMMGLC